MLKVTRDTYKCDQHSYVSAWNVRLKGNNKSYTRGTYKCDHYYFCVLHQHKNMCIGLDRKHFESEIEDIFLSINYNICLRFLKEPSH